MDVLILSFHDEDDECVEFEAVVDTLDPICAVIDNDGEPEMPDFPGCTLHDSSYSSDEAKNSFIVDYGIEDDASLDVQKVEAGLRDFLDKAYGIVVLSFAPLEEEPLPSPVKCPPRP